MSEMTYYEPKWRDGTPPSGADGYWLGESADSRHWLLKWIPEAKCWGAAGFAVVGAKQETHPEIRLLRDDNATAIVRFTALPATRAEEK